MRRQRRAPLEGPSPCDGPRRQNSAATATKSSGSSSVLSTGTTGAVVAAREVEREVSARARRPRAEADPTATMTASSRPGNQSISAPAFARVLAPSYGLASLCRQQAAEADAQEAGQQDEIGK